ncbi:hypothetical protein [Campylobacter fetus]|uniref:hypothetical protein n=1 Tax=Campylobacter fetus TaxID=196 RepID=UPI00190AD2AA|nr:hypothetical protein [Campylobacter fetus]MBK3501324.1 hypothetical protein [Campylobacter fetus subsp. venerealis]
MKIFIETFIGRKNEQTKYLHQCSCQYNNTDMIKELKWWQEISAGIKSKDEFLLGVKQVMTYSPRINAGVSSINKSSLLL